VLALGDVQYEAGELANFQQAYDRSWGAFKAKTYPVVGNHEYLGGDGAAGYGVYRLIMYPDRWIGAFKGVDGNTYDRTGQRCH
jgi:hypothetical protein